MSLSLQTVVSQTYLSLTTVRNTALGRPRTSRSIRCSSMYHLSVCRILAPYLSNNVVTERHNGCHSANFGRIQPRTDTDDEFSTWEMLQINYIR